MTGIHLGISWQSRLAIKGSDIGDSLHIGVKREMDRLQNELKTECGDFLGRDGVLRICYWTKILAKTAVIIHSYFN